MAFSAADRPLVRHATSRVDLCPWSGGGAGPAFRSGRSLVRRGRRTYFPHRAAPWSGGGAGPTLRSRPLVRHATSRVDLCPWSGGGAGPTFRTRPLPGPAGAPDLLSAQAFPLVRRGRRTCRPHRAAPWSGGGAGPTLRSRPLVRHATSRVDLWSLVRRGRRTYFPLGPLPGPAGAPDLLSAPGRLYDTRPRVSISVPGPAGAPDLLSAPGRSLVRRGRRTCFPLRPFHWSGGGAGPLFAARDHRQPPRELGVRAAARVLTRRPGREKRLRTSATTARPRIPDFTEAAFFARTTWRVGQASI